MKYPCVYRVIRTLPKPVVDELHQKPVLDIPLSWLWALLFSVFVWTCLIGLVVLLT